MSLDLKRNDAVRWLTKHRDTVFFKGTVIRAGSFVVDGMTRFVFTIKDNDDCEVEVFTTAPNRDYFQTLLGVPNPISENLHTILLTYASQVKVGDKVDVLVLRQARVIHFIEPEPLSKEKAKELDIT
jgi:hypothetical protein